MKARYVLLTLFIISLVSFLHAQSPPRIGILNIDAVEMPISSAGLGNLLRLELQKTGQYHVIDKYDLEEKLKGTDIDQANCYSENCLFEAARILNADKMMSGSVELFGDKIIVTLKILDVSTATLEKTEVGEFIDSPRELQHMITISMNKLIGKENDPALESSLDYYTALSTSHTTRINNNGPRMGVAYISGDMANRLMAPLDEGGYDMYPVMTQFGYQQEWQYMSSGNFQALAEFIFLLSGLEQSTFIPSMVILNGFRSSKHGFEFGFGPSLSIRKLARGYFDDQGEWHLSREWDIAQGENPYNTVERLDSRGEFYPFTRWVWAVGKTFRSGYLNIPVNIYASPRKSDLMIGLSVGFNIRKARQ